MGGTILAKTSNIKKYIEKSQIYLGIDAKDKDSFIRKILSNLKEEGVPIDDEKILEGINKKESIGTSALGYGVAFPHTYTDSVQDAMIIFATSKQGIIFDSVDSKPVHLAIMFITPKSQSTQYLGHLSILAKVVHLPMHVVVLAGSKTEKEFRENILSLIDDI